MPQLPWTLLTVKRICSTTPTLAPYIPQKHIIRFYLFVHIEISQNVGYNGQKYSPQVKKRFGKGLMHLFSSCISSWAWGLNSLLITFARTESKESLCITLIVFTAHCSFSCIPCDHSLHICRNMKMRAGFFFYLKWDLNFRPFLHSSSNDLQVDTFWKWHILFCVKQHTWKGFLSTPACVSLRGAVLLSAFWYGNMLLLKNLFCNTVILWFKPSGGVGGICCYYFHIYF